MKVVVEVLYFDGCPGIEAALESVKTAVSRCSHAEAVELRTVQVTDEESAHRLRFLGSPSVRVDGRDVEPEADKRSDFGVQCRVYSVDGRLRNTPARAWIERALGAQAEEAR